MKLHRGKHPRGNQIDMAGVAGSTPVEPTIFENLKPGQFIEIPEGIDVIPYLEWDNLKPREHWLLRKKSRKSCKNSVNGKRRKQTA